MRTMIGHSNPTACVRSSHFQALAAPLADERDEKLRRFSTVLPPNPSPPPSSHQPRRREPPGLTQLTQQPRPPSRATPMFVRMLRRAVLCLPAYRGCMSWEDLSWSQIKKSVPRTRALTCHESTRENPDSSSAASS